MIRFFCLVILASPAIAQEGLRVEGEASAARERLTAGRGPWSEDALQVEAREPSGTLWTGRYRETERFGLRDAEAGVGLFLRLASDWGANFEATASDTHRVLPKYSLFAQAERQLRDGWGIHVGLRGSEYAAGDVALLLLTLERYYGNQRLAYTHYSGKPDGAGSAPSHRVQWSYFFGDRASIHVSLARGREVENVVPGGLLTSHVRDVTLFGRYWFAPNWALSAEADAHVQGDLYRRHGFRLGIRHRF